MATPTDDVLLTVHGAANWLREHGVPCSRQRLYTSIARQELPARAIANSRIVLIRLTDLKAMARANQLDDLPAEERVGEEALATA